MAKLCVVHASNRVKAYSREDDGESTLRTSSRPIWKNTTLTSAHGRLSPGAPQSEEGSPARISVLQNLIMTMGDGKLGVEETASHGLNQEPGVIHSSWKHVSKVQQSLPILDRPYQPSWDPQIRQAWKTIIFKCKGLLKKVSYLGLYSLHHDPRRKGCSN